MSVGFFGIQFGWGLQMANTSAIFEHLGASPHQIPILWLAAPLTGLIVQPIIGNLSDNTWGPLGRRRPYFLVGAILSSIALILMPNSSSLWMAAGLLWLLDTSANISMEPFRAFVGDLLPPSQRTKGFAMQSLFIGLGSVIASILPWVLTRTLRLGELTGVGEIPLAVKVSFYVGGSRLLQHRTVDGNDHGGKAPQGYGGFSETTGQAAGHWRYPAGNFYRHSRHAPDHAPAGLGAGL